MEMYQDGVRVWNCIGYCSADVEKRNPAVDIENVRQDKCIVIRIVYITRRTRKWIRIFLESSH